MSEATRPPARPAVSGEDDPDRGSLSRLPLPRRDDMAVEERELFDSLIALQQGQASTGTGLGLRGPLGIVLHSPQLARATTETNEYLRFQAGLTERVREVAILTVAREADSTYEWAAHEPVARRAGVPDDVIAAIRERSALAGLDQADAALIGLVREAVSEPEVTQSTFDAALAQFGKRQLVDIVGLCAQYLGTAAMLKVFALRMPDTDCPSLPKPW